MKLLKLILRILLAPINFLLSMPLHHPEDPEWFHSDESRRAYYEAIERSRSRFF